MGAEQAAIFGEDYFDAGRVRKSKALTRTLFNNELVGWLRRTWPAALDGSGRRALEIGCGYGYVSQLIAEYGYDVLGTDISVHAIDRARQESGGPRVDFAVWDAGEATMAGQFDLIVALEVIEHLPEPEAALSSWAALLAPGGALLCTTPNRYGPLSRYWRDPTHINVRSQRAWKRAFRDVRDWQRLSIGAVQFVPLTWHLDGVLRCLPLPEVGGDLRILAAK